LYVYKQEMLLNKGKMADLMEPLVYHS